MSEKNHKFLRKLIRGALASRPDLAPQKETSYIAKLNTKRERSAPVQVMLADGKSATIKVTVTTATMVLDPKCVRAFARKMKRSFK